MPTIQVSPTASALLQDVANTLGKSKKVVIVTGAGISTNSGIPDFRSEHGLYSLIQAQFEKAAGSGLAKSDNVYTNCDNERPTKQRRTSKTGRIALYGSPPSQTSETSSVDPEPRSMFPGLSSTTVTFREAPNSFPQSPSAGQGDMEMQDTPRPLPESPSRVTDFSEPFIRPPVPRDSIESSVHSFEANEVEFSLPEVSAASSQTDDSILCSDPASITAPSAASTPKRIVAGEQAGSSPLSSPPPVIFDPYEMAANQGTQSSSQGDSDSEDSSTEDGASQSDVFSSQNSPPGLRNIKGRDLFDCNIWSDPVKTSVFYRFATSLRQKVKEVEPTTTHHFIARLRDIGKLARVYTQNIDEIEKKIGLSTDLKSGPGGKRRKSTKQPWIEADEESRDTTKSLRGEHDGGAKEAGQSSQVSEEGEPTRPKVTYVQEKGVECVFLHGSLHSLRCFQCARLSDWDDDGRESLTMSGEQPKCPHCAGATAARQERGKRALGVGKLRPDIVLYGEEHPQSDLISPIVQHDLSAGPDLLLLLGTSLRVHGLKVIVKEFAKAVHTKGGKVVFINFTKPSASTWGDMIDYWVQWDCDAWVDDLKERKPTLWMSPDAAVEHEKQKRETILAEKKRDSVSNKRRRESVSSRKEDNAGRLKKREVMHAVEHEPNAPPKNPASMRMDQLCGAYCLSAISDAFAAIRGEPFDLFGHAPSAQQKPSAPSCPPTVRLPKEKKPAIEKRPRPRKSAPAALNSVLDLQPKPEVRPRPAVKSRDSTWNRSARKSDFGLRPAIKASAFQAPMNSARYNERAARWPTTNLTPDLTRKMAELCDDEEKYLKATTQLFSNHTTEDAKRLAAQWGTSASESEALAYAMGLADPNAPAPRGDDEATPQSGASGQLGNFTTDLGQNGVRTARTPKPRKVRKAAVANPGRRIRASLAVDPVQQRSVVGDSSTNPAPGVKQDMTEPCEKIADTSGILATATSVDGPSSIAAAVKSHHRIRKPKAIFGNSVDVVKPAQSRKLAKSTPVSVHLPVAMYDQENTNTLPPIRTDRTGQPAGPTLATMEPMPDVSPRSPLESKHTLLPGPLPSLSPNSRAIGLRHMKFPMMGTNPFLLLHCRPQVEPTIWVPRVRDSPLARSGIPSPSGQLWEDMDGTAPALQPSGFPRRRSRMDM